MNQPNPDLGGLTVVRNGIRLGYCFVECIQSLLEVCSEVVAADVDSTDGTLEKLQRMTDHEPSLKVVKLPWTNPVSVGPEWWIGVMNQAREHLTKPMMLQLDADETIDTFDSTRVAIDRVVERRMAARVRRLNYWKSPEWLIPSGHCCGDAVVRLGPSNLRIPTDAPCRVEDFPIVGMAQDVPEILIHHLGFLRKPEYFYAKSKAVQSIWNGSYDDRLVKVEEEQKPQWEVEDTPWTNDLVRTSSSIPEMAQRWMSKQGHRTELYLGHSRYADAPTTARKPKVAGRLRFRHTGDLGDIVASLPTIRQMGGGEVILGNSHPHHPREPMSQERYDFIAPLLEVQPYVSRVSYDDSPDQIDVDFAHFRAFVKVPHENLAQWHASATQTSHLDQSPWLQVHPSEESRGKVIFSRTERYRNSTFPWRTVARRYPNGIFLGTDAEWRDFYRSCGKMFPHRKVSSALEAAELIAGSDLFIGNQSCLCWIAMGLGHPLIQETCRNHPDSRVPRDNARYVENGKELMQ